MSENIEKNCFSRKVVSKKIFDQKKSVQKNLGPKKLLVPKNGGPKNISTEKFKVQKMQG